MRPVIRGIVGGLLLSLGVVAGVNLISTVGSHGNNIGFGPTYYAMGSTTTSARTTTASAGTTPASAKANTSAINAPVTNQNASLNSAVTQASTAKSSLSGLPSLLPIAAALALGASAYLLSRSRIEKEA